MAFNPNKCMKITALESGCAITAGVSLINGSHYYFSKDNGSTWVQDTITLNANEFAYCKGTAFYQSEAGKDQSLFTISKPVKISGSIMSLVDDGAGELLSMVGGGFHYAFKSCSNIIEISEDFLPATVLSDRCYYGLFQSCTGLQEIPKNLLPATELAKFCYSNLFAYCSNLKEAPELPATELTIYCYTNMFIDCSNLKEAPELPAIKLAKYCYQAMFAYCSNLEEAPELPATELAEACYYNMFNHCTKIEGAPELPATELAEACYSNMFIYCSNLKEAPELPATELANSCYLAMFAYCTNLEEAPELPAVELESKCYMSMFNSCSALRQIKVSFTDWNTPTGQSGNTTNWVQGVATDGKFICPKELPIVAGTSGIPETWDIVYPKPKQHPTTITYKLHYMVGSRSS